MLIDDESDLKDAFARLNRSRRDQAPEFEVMRQRALQSVDCKSQATLDPQHRLRAVAVAAFSFVLIGSVAWLINARPSFRQQASTGESGSAAQLDQLIVSIEQQFNLNDALLSPNYPTDVLLTQYSTGAVE